MPIISEIRHNYLPDDLKDIRGYVFFTTGHVHLDGYFTTEQLTKLVQFIEAFNSMFREWYATCVKIEPKLHEDPVNAFYQDFAAGKSPEQSVKDSGHYGMRKE